MRKRELKLVKVKIMGININNYVKKLIRNKISVIKLIPINYKEVHIIMPYNDYIKLKSIPSIYEITLVEGYGLLKVYNILKKNYILIISILIGLSLLYILSNIIFSVEVVHSKSSIRNIVLNSLEEYGIKKYTWKKDFNELEEIKEKILEDNKENIEWLEIIPNGIKYIVKVEERIINKENSGYEHQSIVASKNATIIDIKALKGEKVVSNGSYVKEGDKIISGIITNTNGESILVKAIGSVIGEVWYKVNVEYPYVYREEILTGKSNKVLSINFLSHKYSLFNYSKYKEFNTKSNIILKHNFLPFYISIDKQYELKVIDEILTQEEAANRAIQLAKDKLLEGNNKIISVKDVLTLSKNIGESKIELNLFFKVEEDIGKYVEEKYIEESQ